MQHTLMQLGHWATFRQFRRNKLQNCFSDRIRFSNSLANKIMYVCQTCVFVVHLAIGLGYSSLPTCSTLAVST